MNLNDCKELGRILAENPVEPSIISSIQSLDNRIERYFNIWCEILKEEEQVRIATGYRMVNKYGFGWEVNRDVLPEHYRAELLIAGPEVLGEDFDPDDYVDISLNNV